MTPVRVAPWRPAPHNDLVTAIAWTLVGLMAASLGVLSAALFSGLARIDALGARLDGRIDALGARIDARFDSVDARIDRLGEQVHALDVRLTRAGG